VEGAAKARGKLLSEGYFLKATADALAGATRAGPGVTKARGGRAGKLLSEGYFLKATADALAGATRAGPGVTKARGGRG
jgi:hypothetical protein